MVCGLKEEEITSDELCGRMSEGVVDVSLGLGLKFCTFCRFLQKS